MKEEIAAISELYDIVNKIQEIYAGHEEILLKTFMMAAINLGVDNAVPQQKLINLAKDYHDKLTKLKLLEPEANDNDTPEKQLVYLSPVT